MTSPSDTDEFRSQADYVTFAHASEEQFARLLDFYSIDWEYEPKSFPIEFDCSGTPTSYFTPDFYLPGEDLFIDITTMSQRLVTKKNRKVRRLREVHPEVNCKVFYQRDYLHLLIKYGLGAGGDGGEQTAVPTRVPGPPQVVNLGHRATG